MDTNLSKLPELVMERKAWRAAVHKVSESDMTNQLTMLAFILSGGTYTQFKPFPGSVQFSHSVVSNSLWPYGLQHARPPCPSPTPGVYSNSCPSSWWCHATISSSAIPFSSSLQSFPASGSFPMSQFFASGGQSIDYVVWIMETALKMWIVSINLWTCLKVVLSSKLNPFS